MDNATIMGGALWFFKSLFFVLLLFGGVSFTFRKLDRKYWVIIIQGILSILFLIIGYIDTPLPMEFRRVLTVYFLLYFGMIIKKYDVISLILSLKHRVIWSLLMFTVSLIILLICYYSVGLIELSNNKIVNPIYFVFVSMIGWIFVQSISNLLIICNSKFNSIIDRKSVV